MPINLLLNDYCDFLMRTVHIWIYTVHFTYKYCYETDFSHLILDGKKYFALRSISMSYLNQYIYYVFINSLNRFVTRYFLVRLLLKLAVCKRSLAVGKLEELMKAAVNGAVNVCK